MHHFGIGCDRFLNDSIVAQQTAENPDTRIRLGDPINAVLIDADDIIGRPRAVCSTTLIYPAAKSRKTFNDRSISSSEL